MVFNFGDPLRHYFLTNFKYSKILHFPWLQILHPSFLTDPPLRHKYLDIKIIEKQPKIFYENFFTRL